MSTYSQIKVSSEDDIDKQIGLLHKSIISSVLMFHRYGGGLQSVMEFKRLVDSISATLWTMLVLGIQAKDGDEQILTDIGIQTEQLYAMIDRTLTQIEKWTTEVCANDESES